MSKKMNELHQAHGKIENPVTLDQIWGDTGISKYGTLDLSEYEKYLDDLNKSDLQAHASKMNLVPVDDRKTLVERLKREFIKHASLYNKPSNQSEIKISKRAKDILAEGK